MLHKKRSGNIKKKRILTNSTHTRVTSRFSGVYQKFEPQLANFSTPKLAQMITSDITLVMQNLVKIGSHTASAHVSEISERGNFLYLPFLYLPFPFFLSSPTAKMTEPILTHNGPLHMVSHKVVPPGVSIIMENV